MTRQTWTATVSAVLFVVLAAVIALASWASVRRAEGLVAATDAPDSDRDTVFE